MMRMLGRLLSRFGDDSRGSALIETAIVAPVLVLMSLGGVEVANMVKRQHELQNATSKSAEIIMASKPNGVVELGILMLGLANKIQADTGLKASVLAPLQEPDETKSDVAYVMLRYRCGNSNTFKKSSSGCTDSSNTREFIVLLLRDKYTPVWNDFGIGEDLQYRVEKAIQIG